MYDHALRAVDASTCAMEHALRIGCGKKNAKKQEEQAIGNHAGKAGKNQAGEGEKCLDQENIALLEVPETKLAKQEEADAGSHPTKEQQEAGEAFTDEKHILCVQGKYGDNDTHSCIEDDDPNPTVESKRSALIDLICLLILLFLTFHGPDAGYQGTAGCNHQEDQEEQGYGDEKRQGGRTFDEQPCDKR